MFKHIYRLSAFLLACLLAQALFPVSARAYTNLTASDAVIDLIDRYEGFSSKMYYENGKWYVGYGTQVEEGAYPDSISKEDAAALVHKELADIEKTLNNACSSAGVTLTQGQFDALSDFTYIHGDAWLKGSSQLAQLARGKEMSRRETARAFGVWSHSGGRVLPALARRHLEEAALYLDGSTDNRNEFVFLSIEKRDGVIYSSDFAVYERGSVYDAFPAMFLLGYTLTGAQTADGKILHIGDPVEDGYACTPVWEKNVYSTVYSDVLDGDWFYDYVMELSEGGVVNGRGDGVFDPQASVTVGEALKLILLAAGKAESPADAGAHWASGYAAVAREKDYLEASVLEDLDRPIRRGDVARLAAKAIGFGQSFDTSPFADTKNGYAAALAGIGVLNGITENGKSYFYPDKLLTRAEVSAIVWRLRSQVALGVSQSVRYASRDYDVNADLALNDYDPARFSGKGVTMTYSEPDVTTLRGIDVSKHQGSIDWTLAAQNIDFAILRVGGRFWGSGDIYEDKLFEEFYTGAEKQDLRLGYYFYSQAITPEEAVEEADFVIGKLQGKRVDAPVVFDWETAGSKDARTNGLPVSVVCDCAIAFCERIKAAGYTPMIYMNTYDGYVRYDLSRLQSYPIWYAGQYNKDYPQFVYHFDIWQYTSTGDVKGINGGVDMDLWFFR